MGSDSQNIKEKGMYEYRVKVVKIIDGDTVDVDIDLGFGVWLKKERIRLFGIDTPCRTFPVSNALWLLRSLLPVP